MNGWFLTHPATRGIDIDDPRLTEIRHRLLWQKKFLFKLYEDCYNLMKENLGNSSSKVIELGSGAGFLEMIIPQVTKTDIFSHPFIHLVMDGLKIPFPAESYDAILLLDVFHHLPDVKEFLQEAVRTLVVGGRIIMIEPWVTPWSKKAYSYLNNEPVVTDIKNWHFKSSGPLSGSNQALPWIVYCRDKELFQLSYPQLEIIKIQPMMPFRFIFSGGLSTWIGLPGFFYSLIKRFETLFEKKMDNWGMFALIVLEKIK
jgi:SAM-dependent methyltransferase